MIALLAFLTVAVQEKDHLDGHPGIANYYRIAPDIAASGQPTDDALADIKEAGFKTILNLRTEEEGSLDEKPKVEALGLEYFNIPIGSDGITKESVELFSKIVNDAEARPLFIHCASSNRVGALWYIHRVLSEGADEDAALEEARKAGLKPNLEPRAREFVEKNRPH
jgi:uncharacterized protein (TIGR01244 family)